jgi:hypothetical protein
MMTKITEDQLEHLCLDWFRLGGPLLPEYAAAGSGGLCGGFGKAHGTGFAAAETRAEKELSMLSQELLFDFENFCSGRS